MPEIVLKDWYGKEQTFDRDVIFAANPQGDLEPFTHGVVKPLEIAENGTFQAPEGVAGYSPVVANIPAPEINLQEKTITENGEYTADDGFDGLSKVLVDVAGSGGGGILVAQAGTFIGNGVSSGVIVSHTLGTVPLMVFCVYATNYTTSDMAQNITPAQFGVSSAVTDILGTEKSAQLSHYWNATTAKFVYAPRDYAIDSGEEGSGDILATDTYIKFARTSKSGVTYMWLAIGLKNE